MLRFTETLNQLVPKYLETTQQQQEQQQHNATERYCSGQIIAFHVKTKTLLHVGVKGLNGVTLFYNL